MSFIGDLATLMLILLILVIVSLILSIISLVFMKRSAVGGTAAHYKVVAESIEEGVSSPPTSPKFEKVARLPPNKQITRHLEIKPPAPEEWIAFTSIGELATMIGANSLILFNQSGIPIESHNVADENRVAASLADFVVIMRKFNPNFESMISENDRRMALISVGRFGDTEVFAFTVGEPGMGLEVEEIKGFLRTYLAESLGRYK